MRTRLLIVFEDEDTVSWATFTPQGHLLEQAQQVALTTVPDLPAWVILPGWLFTLTQVDIPSRQRQRILQATPFALEEYLAQEIETLHFSLGQRDPNTGNIAVAIIAHDILQSYLHCLTAAQRIPQGILPATLSIPLPDRGWGILPSATQVLVRTGLQAGFAIEPDNLLFMLEQALTENSRPEQLVIYQNNQQLPDLTILDIPLVYTEPTETLAYFCQALTYTPALNILQGVYQPQSQWLELSRPWRFSALLMVLLVGIWLVQYGVDYRHLLRQRQQFEQQTIDLYKKTFPEAHKIVNPRVQMEQQLTVLRDQQRGSTGEQFLTTLGQLSLSFSHTPGFQLKQLMFNEQQFTFSITVANLPALEHLRRRLTTAGFSVDIQSTQDRAQAIDAYLQLTLF